MMLIISLLVITAIAVLCYLFPVIQICGPSMNPTFHNGDIVLGCRLFSLEKGKVYVFNPPAGEQYVIKRLTHISELTGKLFFEGDNSDESYDSRYYGYVTKDKVVAKYVFTIYKRKECNDNGCS